MDEPWKHCVKEKEAKDERSHGVWLIWYKYPE